MRKLQGKLKQMLTVSFSYRTRSIRIRWRQISGVCRREKKEEAAMLRKQVTAVWRPCGSNISPWEQMEVERLQREMRAAHARKRRRKKK